ncbi:MAG: hypothetical protein ABR527_05645 [Gemmatimonadota bacterium]
MEDLLFERLERMDSEVPPEVVLQDIYFLDRIVRPLTGPQGDDYRVPFLAEALDSRHFFSDAEASWEAIDLYDDLCDLCSIRTYGSLARVLERFRAYCRDKSEPVPRSVDEA